MTKTELRDQATALLYIDHHMSKYRSPRTGQPQQPSIREVADALDRPKGYTRDVLWSLHRAGYVRVEYQRKRGIAKGPRFDEAVTGFLVDVLA